MYEVIPFREFMDGSYKRDKTVTTYSFFPVGGIVMNEPTVFLLTTVGIGIAAIILEQIAEGTESPKLESIRRFKSTYNQYIVPTSVVGCGVYVFARLVKILL